MVGSEFILKCHFIPSLRANTLQANQTRYPTMARIARDYLAIPGASTSAERAFSSARRISTEFRRQIGPDKFEAIQILKAAYQADVRIAPDSQLTPD